MKSTAAQQVTLAHGTEVPRAEITESIIERGTVLRIGGRPEIALFWETDSSLRIDYRLRSPTDRIFLKKLEWDGISIRFNELPASR